MRLSKVLGVVSVGLFVLTIAVAHTGPATPKLLSGGTLLGPSDLGTPGLFPPRVYSLPAVEQKHVKAPVAILPARANKPDVHASNRGVIPAPTVSGIEATMAPTPAVTTVALKTVSPQPAKPKPVAPKVPAPKAPAPKPPPPKPPAPKPVPPTVAPDDGDHPVTVVVVIVYSHDEHGDDQGDGRDASCDHRGDQKDDHSQDGSSQADKAPEPSNASQSVGHSPIGSPLGASSEQQ